MTVPRVEPVLPHRGDLTAGESPDFSPADEDYRWRFAFTGTLHRVDIGVSGTAVVDPEITAQ